MGRLSAVVALALLLAGCPGERKRGVVLLEGGPARDGAGGPPDYRPADKPPLPWLIDLGRRTDTRSPSPDGWTGSDDIGKPCTSGATCKYQLCAMNIGTGQTFCTMQCNPCSALPCPAGSGCQPADVTYICAPGYPNTPCN